MAEPLLDARIVKRSLSIAGHSTSISLEEPFWRELKALAEAEGASLAALVARLDGERRGIGLSSALRLHVLRTLKARIARGTGGV
jgi:predicted DNA-binding ribbon-helix-helix protein